MGLCAVEIRSASCIIERHRYNAKSEDVRQVSLVFFGCAGAVVVLVIVINNFVYDIRPGHSQLECTNGCANNARPEACKRFCNCIYNEGQPLDKCLEEYRKRKE